MFDAPDGVIAPAVGSVSGFSMPRRPESFSISPKVWSGAGGEALVGSDISNACGTIGRSQEVLMHRMVAGQGDDNGGTRDLDLYGTRFIDHFFSSLGLVHKVTDDLDDRQLQR